MPARGRPSACCLARVVLAASGPPGVRAAYHGALVDPLILLFSGGRDSTLAALRLAAARRRLLMVTVTSEHLVGVDAVRHRLDELESHLIAGTEWLHVAWQRATLAEPVIPTCLPCHHGYLSVGLQLAAQRSIRMIALGYAGYQAHWPEQTPEAVTVLRGVAAEVGCEVELPVYDIRSKADAITQLQGHGVTANSLEQKCLRQVSNVTLDHETLVGELVRWERELRRFMSLPFSVLETRILGRL